jgi:beta-N-acetylhexosaminidase
LITLVTLFAVLGTVKSGWLDSGGGSTEPGKALASHAEANGTGNSTHSEGHLPIRRAMGQMIVARFNGPNPSPRFLTRVRRGQIGGVILFTENLEGDGGEIASRIQRLQGAAESGGNPPLLTMVDQEGGTVKRLPGPPLSSAAGMSSGDARGEGEATGDLLARLGIDVDLAPVVDIGHPGSFLGSRSFASRPSQVASLACEFAAGLRSQGVAPTLKHFPGLGWADVNTDDAAVTVSASAAQLRSDYAPYRMCAEEPLTLVMIDTAIYPSLAGARPAVMAPPTYERELPRTGFSGVTISDDLETPAIQSQTTPARRSLNAGLDLLLYAGAENTSADAYRRLLEDIRSGAISSRKVQSAAAKILALKEELSG